MLELCYVKHINCINKNAIKKWILKIFKENKGILIKKVFWEGVQKKDFGTYSLITSEIRLFVNIS